MKILHISDTHGKHHEIGPLPAADVLVHSGDFTDDGTDREAVGFIEWLCEQPYMYKIFIAGNHDECMLDATLEGLPDNVYYLHDNGITIEGVSFFGTPMFVGMIENKMKIIENHNNIPSFVDVLITHRPPFGILDCGLGSPTILEKCVEIHPRLHLFGHVHEGYGVVNGNKTVYSNASICGGNKPHVFNL